ncbi:MAG: cation transporter, partial [Abditibacteriota bacterium]|nr:cation transporter [Abditibacteriota bacterium]
NLSDALSSVITISGARLAAQKPDKNHPFGHGRFEYLSAMVISVIVAYAGLASLAASVKKIISPATPRYGAAALVIIAVAVAVKIAMGVYVKKAGQRVNSNALINSGEDARMDAVISAATLAAAAVYMRFGISLEAWLAAAISLYIIAAGFRMLKETVSDILGQRNDPELIRKISDTVKSFDGVEGVYDPVLNNYGPDAWNGSLHIAVPSHWTADDVDRLSREIMKEVYRRHGIILTAVGIYSRNTEDRETAEAHKKVHEIVHRHRFVNEVHGFYLNKETRTIRFDLVISLEAENRSLILEHIRDEVAKEFPGYTPEVVMDTDFAEV